jgi:flagellar hook assembly protein FlgD
VAVRVWSSAGRLVNELFAGELAAGASEFTWNLADGSGLRVPAGAYFVELNAAGHNSRMKLSVLD